MVSRVELLSKAVQEVGAVASDCAEVRAAAKAINDLSLIDWLSDAAPRSGAAQSAVRDAFEAKSGVLSRSNLIDHGGGTALSVRDLSNAKFEAVLKGKTITNPWSGFDGLKIAGTLELKPSEFARIADGADRYIACLRRATADNHKLPQALRQAHRIFDTDVASSLEAANISLFQDRGVVYRVFRVPLNSEYKTTSSTVLDLNKARGMNALIEENKDRPVGRLLSKLYHPNASARDETGIVARNVVYARASGYPELLAMRDPEFVRKASSEELKVPEELAIGVPNTPHRGAHPVALLNTAYTRYEELLHTLQLMNVDPVTVTGATLKRAQAAGSMRVSEWATNWSQKTGTVPELFVAETEPVQASRELGLRPPQSFMDTYDRRSMIKFMPGSKNWFEQVDAEIDSFKQRWGRFSTYLRSIGEKV